MPACLPNLSLSWNGWARNIPNDLSDRSTLFGPGGTQGAAAGLCICDMMSRDGLGWLRRAG